LTIILGVKIKMTVIYGELHVFPDIIVHRKNDFLVITPGEIDRGHGVYGDRAEIAQIKGFGNQIPGTVNGIIGGIYMPVRIGAGAQY
jgi:hypothetical protein